MPRPSLGRSTLLAAAVAGAIVYWRAHDRRRSSELTAIDDAAAEGRAAAERLLSDYKPDDNSFGNS